MIELFRSVHRTPVDHKAWELSMLEKSGLGERIKQFRLSRNLTLKEVEQKAKVSATHVSEIERGLTSPTVGSLTKIAHALGTEPGYFLQTGDYPGVSVVRSDRRSFRARSTLPETS